MSKCNISCQIFGYVGGGLSAFMFLPQLIKIHQRKKAKDISWLTLIMANTASTFILLYTIQTKSTALAITSSISIIIRFIIMIYKFIVDKD
jgi:uncharacterized protein with PQ loop repeat